jgi:hypothetical protein
LFPDACNACSSLNVRDYVSYPYKTSGKIVLCILMFSVLESRRNNTTLSLSLSLLGSTAQLRSWPPPQYPAKFLGGFSTVFFFTG